MFNMKFKAIRIILLGSAAVLVFLIVIGKLVIFQLIDHDKYAGELQHKMRDTMTKYAPRGKILDSNGEEIAVSIMAGTLCVDPTEMESKKNDPKLPKRDVKRLAAQLLSPVLNISESKLYDKFTELDTRFVYVKCSDRKSVW